MSARTIMQLRKFSKRLLWGSLVFLFSSLGYADFQIQDPKNILADLSSRLHALPFEQSMTCNQSVRFSGSTENCQVKCNARFCKTECTQPANNVTTLNLVTEECAIDSIAIYGSNGFSALLTKEDYQAGGNTWLVGLIKNLGHFIQPEGTLILNEVRSRMFKEIVNGQMQTFFGYMIEASIEILPNTMTLSFEIGIDPRASGLNQIVLVRFTNSDTFLKRKGIIDAGPF